jgi:hypothetical protein
MKKLLLATFAFLTTAAVFSQTKKDLSISFAAGAFNSPYYTNDKKREFYSFDFDHYIGSRHILSANFLKGSHRYYDNVHTANAVPLSTPGYENHTNTEADYMTFSVLYKYKLVNYKNLSVNVGAGAGIMTQVIEYPINVSSVNIIDFGQSSWTDLVFPTRLEIDYQFAKHFKFGVLAGLYIHPDYPTLGNHAGFRLSYLIK